MPEVTEQWSEATYVRGESAGRTFYVTGVDDANAAINALAASTFNVEYGSLHPLDDRLFVPTGGISVSRKGFLYALSVSYGTEGGFTFEPDPLDQPWRTTIEWVEQEEPAERTWSGAPAVNSNLEPLDPPLTRLFTSIVITMWRWESTYNLAQALAFKDKVNLDAVTLPKLGTAAAGELICRAIKPLDEFEPDTPRIKVGYTFEARPLMGYDGGNLHGFHRRIIDAGYTMNTAEGVALIAFKEGPDAGNPVKSPVRLNGYGAPLDSTNFASADPAGFGAQNRPTAPFPLETTADAVFLLVDESAGGIAFSGLQINANL